MMVTYKLSELGKLTEEGRKRIQEAAKKPICFDEDCPESTPEMLREFQKAAAERNRRDQKLYQG